MKMEAKFWQLLLVESWVLVIGLEHAIYLTFLYLLPLYIHLFIFLYTLYIYLYITLCILYTFIYPYILLYTFIYFMQFINKYIIHLFKSIAEFFSFFYTDTMS